jgi:uncharacterized membrane protein
MASYNGISPGQRWENLDRETHRSSGGPSKTGRIVSGVAGAALLVLSFRRKRLRGLLLPVATGLISRAIAGRPAAKPSRGKVARKERRSPLASVPRGQGIKVEESVIINRPVPEVYRFWRNLENLPRFMDHLESVTVLDEIRSHWAARGPAGTRVEWDAVIHNDIDDELIAWRSLPGSEVDNAGSVHFTPAAGGGTQVRVVLSYAPPAGKVGAAVAKLLGEEPSQQVGDDLRRLKQVLDVGEVPGRSHSGRV